MDKGGGFGFYNQAGNFEFLMESLTKLMLKICLHQTNNVLGFFKVAAALMEAVHNTTESCSKTVVHWFISLNNY